ncbi:MAG: serine/threonine-protein phosphatase [Planctomycetes bacterium]|nr:serine/threonine-protein phosphatase [Planctomycetota bacterium]
MRTLQMTYCRAGHPYPVLIRKGQQPRQLQSQGGLIGVFPETHFEQDTIQLQHGDKLFIYSDGGENVVGGFNEKNEFAFSEEFRSIVHLPLDSMMQSFDLLAKNNHVSPQEVDDVTAIALEIV